MAYRGTRPRWRWIRNQADSALAQQRPNPFDLFRSCVYQRFESLPAVCLRGDLGMPSQ